MASDYEDIKNENIRRYGDDEDHLSIYSEQYAERTHFIFELLQNADDEGAERILFRFSGDDALEILHDGKIFYEIDVRGICGIGKSTKKGNPAKIGKFGIGFKAVYAYTSVPEVHSGDEHFRIEHYVRPSAAPVKNPGEGWTTLFVLHFDPTKVPAATATQEIAARLRGLTATTLLFLRSIKEVVYVLADGTGGTYLRDPISHPQGRLVTVIGESGGKEESERWLVFERPVPVPDGTDSVAVEIAFKLETGPKGKAEGIAQVRESPLYVFFPTEKQTQFGFLIQGPYKTTPARDNIHKDDVWNATLVSATAALVVEALHEIKERGLLTVAALSALPIRLDGFPTDGIFYPIVAAVRHALRTDELLPAEDGTYVAANQAKLGRGAELRKLLGQDQLSTLFPTSPATKWLSGEITQDRTADLRTYLMNELDVEEVDPEALARKISSAFLLAQSDEWFISFYRYLSGLEALWRAPRWRDDADVGVLRLKPILRLQDDQLAAPFRADGRVNAYLPPPESTDLPSVKKQIVADDYAAAFLRRLGLDEPDIFDDIVHRVLPKYAEATISVPSDEHLVDIQKIFRALASDSETGKKKVVEEARKTTFLKTSNCAGESAYKRPRETYRADDDLRLYFEGFANAWFLDEALPDGAPGDVICDSLGIARRPRRMMFSGEIPPEIKRRSTRSPTIINYKLDGFEHFVGSLRDDNNFETRKSRSLVLWRYISDYLRLDRGFYHGRYDYFYYSDHSISFDSFMLTRLREAEWIPTTDKNLKKPAGLSAEELYTEFREADDLMKLLYVCTEDQSEACRQLQHAAELGVPLEDIEFLKSHPDDFRQWRQSLAQRATKPAFPVRTSADPERRATRISEQWQETAEKEYARREQSVRTSRTAVEPHDWLVEYYTNDDKKMVCQLCGEEMPFKKRNGDYYFEAVEILGREQLTREHAEQFLALCPTCAAKYKEFIKADRDTLNSMKQAILQSDSTEILLSLGDSQESLKFVQIHIDDIKRILEMEDLPNAEFGSI